MVTQKTVNFIQQFCRPGIESGMIPREQLDEMINAVTTEKSDAEVRARPRMLSAKQVAELLNCSTTTVHRMKSSGRLKGVHLTESRKSLRFPLSEIAAFTEVQS